MFDDRARMPLGFAGDHGQRVAGRLQPADHRFDARIHRVLAPTDGVEALVVVLHRQLDAIVIVVEQGREAVAQRRTDPVAHLGGMFHAQLRQRVADAAQDADFRIDQRAVKVEQYMIDRH